MWQTMSMPAHMPLTPPLMLRTAWEHLCLPACEFFLAMEACSICA